jgi:hypothetical protein
MCDDVDEIDELELLPSRANAEPPLAITDDVELRSQIDIVDASPPTINVRPSGNSFTDRI